jgi:hypothetical protein
VINVSWNNEKNEWLKQNRGVSFEEIVQSIFLGSIKHPIRENQRLLFFEVNNYIWVTPATRNGSGVFFKNSLPKPESNQIFQKRWTVWISEK